MERSSGYGNILQESFENLLLAEKQLQDKELQDGPKNYFKTLNQFWKEIDLISKKLSYECTKLCISFCNSPLPSSIEISALLNDIEKAVLALVSVTMKLDPSFGKTLHQELLLSSVGAIQSARQLLRVVKDDGGIGVDERYRQATGIVWEGCKSLENCPKNNKLAVLSLLKGQSSIVNDAYEEISESLEGDGGGWYSLGNLSSDGEENDDEPKWSDEDKQMINPSVNLIKATKILYKRVIDALEKNGSCDNKEQNEELDQIFEDCRPISQVIDSLILEIYPPLHIANMDIEANNLANLIGTALKTATQSHVMTEADQPNTDFLIKAVDHNLCKLKESLQKL